MKLVEVYLWNQLVGVLAWNQKEEKTIFEYNSKFLNTPLEPSPLILPKSKKIIQTDVQEEQRINFDTDKGLPLFISDSLPDRFGTQLFSKYLEKRGRSIRDLTPLEKLTYIGNRGMGALEYRPAISDSKSTSELSLANIQRFSNSLTSDQPIANLDDMANLFYIGTSAGGAQPKIVINIDKNTGDIYRGDNLPQKNEDAWILKFNRDIGLKTDLDRGKVEFAYYLIAKECEINISNSKILSVDNDSYFMTQRFDRVNQNKIHTQTLHAFAGMNYRLPNTYSYEQIFSLLNRIRMNYPAKEQLFRMMCFNCIGKNVDDHTKNFGFTMNQNGEWNFAPAYDLTYTYNENYKRPTPHFLSINGKNNNFTKEDLLQVAKKYSIKNPKNIILQIQEAFNGWNKLGKQLEMQSETINIIGKNLNLLS